MTLKRNLETAVAEGMVLGNKLDESHIITRMQIISDLLTSKADVPNGKELFNELVGLVELYHLRQRFSEVVECIEYTKSVIDNYFIDGTFYGSGIYDAMSSMKRIIEHNKTKDNG